MGEKVTFDLPQFLTEMRKENNERHDDLANKFDELKSSLTEQDKRILVLETHRKRAVWFTGIVVAAIMTAVVPMFIDWVTHLPKG